VNLHNKKLVLSVMAALAALLFAGGILAAYYSRHNTICPNGKIPVAQRSGVIGQIEYRCSNGVVVTK
jgi:hypothetical protein